MDKITAQHLIEKTFNESFSEAQFTLFTKNLLNDLEQGEKVRSYSGNYIWDDFKEHINTYKRIGKYIDPNGEAMDVLIVEVKSIAKLERARTALRNFVIKHLSRFSKDYALVAFYSKEDRGAEWRFSFIKLEYQSVLDEEKGKVKTRTEFTPAKRYSFLVGKCEKTHTAKNQLLPLLQNISNNPTIEELEAAFSIEKVTDEFFNQYKDLYIKLYEHLENDNRVKAEFENAGINNARFTKKLLGQIVFLYFLQKKGWLGVAQNARWGTGNKRFVQELFELAQSEKLNFFKDKLQYLFYEALAKERDNVNSYYKRFDCRIPFLNGGLFEADYNWREANISIPEDLFRNVEKNKSGDVGTGILDVFDRYNFTIKEDEPLDKEVAVDPEMLGKVFENMLDITERKSKGAFYTPREIVHYMCQESLIHYLDNSLNSGTNNYQELGSNQTKLFSDVETKNGQVSIEIEHGKQILVLQKDIELFIRKGHFAIENDERVATKGETKTYQYQLPESIRKNADLIDQELSSIKICDPAIGSGAFPVGLLHELVNAMLVLKPHLSYNYLTDKLKGFGFTQLESVSDSRYIYRLKRHIIQESIYGVDIDSSAIDIARLRLWLSLVVDEDDLDPIETLPNLDYKIVCGNSLIGFPDGWKSPAFEKIEFLKREFYNETDELKKRELKANIEVEIRNRLATSKRVFGYQVDFDFKLFFSEVWREKGGFDVVIGNPPYVGISKVDYKDVLKKMDYETYVTTGDLYVLFYECGYKLLKPRGNVNLITSNKWINASYGTKTRNFFAKKTNPKLLIDFAKVRIFPNATVFVNILMLERSNADGIVDAVTIEGNYLPTVPLENYITIKKVRLSIIGEEVWKIGSSKELVINKAIEGKGLKIKDWDGLIFYRGVTTGLNEAFHIRNEEAAELIKKDSQSSKLIFPLLRGKDIKRWNFSYKDLSIIFTKQGLDIAQFPIIEEYLRKYYDELVPKQKSTDKNGRKPGIYKWFEIQDNTAYFNNFLEPKIIWIEISDRANYAYDENGHFLTNSAYFLSGKHLKYLISVLNSSVADYYFFQITAKIAGGRKRYTKQYVEQIPIPFIQKEEQIPYEKLVDYVILAKSKADEIVFKFFESLLDALVFELYFPEEIKSAGKEILKHLGDLKPITDEMSEEKKLAIIQNEYERLSHPNHPVRIAIETLDSVEEVRIIREALK